MNIPNNISFVLEDHSEYTNNEDQLESLKNFEIIYNNTTIMNSNDDIYAQVKYYDLNYTIKQLCIVCEYYGIL